MTPTARGCYGRRGVGADFLEVLRGIGAAEVVDGGIVGEGDEAVALDYAHGSLYALLAGVFALGDLLHSRHLALQVGLALELLEELGINLEVDIAHLHSSPHHAVVVAQELVGFLVVEHQRQGECAYVVNLHGISVG